MIQGGLFGVDYEPSGKRVSPGNTAKANADRQARFVAQRSDLGEIPAIADPERREKCRSDLALFGEQYCFKGGGRLLARAPSDKLKAYARNLQSAIEGAGMMHIRFPRGAGKTTWVKIAVAWGVAYGHLHFPVIFCASAAQATAVLADIWSIFEFSDTFAADFPEISYPIRAAEGMPQRWLGQSYHGVRTQVKRTSSELHLPVIEGSDASGTVIKGRGAGGSCRGLVQGNMRPDFVLIDDIQTRKDAESAIRTTKLVDWITQDVQGLGGSRLMSIAMTSTPIRQGDLSEQFADTALHPEWQNISYPLMIRWPVNDFLWLEYDEIYRDAIRDGDPTFAAATEFYRKHRAKMDEGGEIIDPGNFDDRLELSALQHARNLLIAMKEDAFNAEYQLRTKTNQDVVALSPKMVAAAINGSHRHTMPKGTVRAVAFIDVNSVAGISWSVCAFGPKQTVAVLDYGRYTAGRSRLVPQSVPERDAQKIVSEAVYHVIQELGARRLVNDRNKRDRLAAIWVDEGYMTDIVRAVCAHARRNVMQNVYSCKGYSNATYQTGAGRHVVSRGFGVDFRRADGAEWFSQNSDIWRETAQRAFLGVPLAPGTISLWGSNPKEHWSYAEEICSETLTDKAVSQRGVTIYKWSLKIGADNHWLDTTSGCFAMASWYRMWDESEVVRTTVRAHVQAVEHTDAATTAATTTAPRKKARYRSACKG